MDIKQEIHKKLLNDDGKITPWISRNNWIKKNNLSDLIDKIHQNTNFLHESADIVERIWCIVNGINIQPTCLVCGNRVRFHRSLKKYSTTCSSKCVTKETKEKTKNTTLKNNNLYIGSEEFNQKAKKTKLERYGNENYNNSYQTKRTCLNKYGVENISYLPQTKKIISEKLTRFRTSDKFLSSVFTEEQLKLLNDRDALEKLHQNKSLIEIASDHNIKYTTLCQYFKKHKLTVNHPNSREFTYPEIIIKRLLDKYGIEFVSHDRSILGNKELDFYIPTYNIAIEVNGLYWHSYTQDNINKEKKLANRNKKLDCLKHNINLIFFTDEEIYNNKEKVESYILTQCGVDVITIYARNCTIKEISCTQTIRTFLTENHLSGYTVSSHNYGLYVDGTLVSIMTFGTNRFGKDNNNTFEIVRYATLKGTRVVGGFSKLLKFFIRTHKPSKIISYADMKYSAGKVYEKNDFVLDYITQPDYYWISPGDHKRQYHILKRYQTQKNKLSKILENFDPTKTEDENMFESGFRKYYSCGHMRYSLTL